MNFCVFRVRRNRTVRIWRHAWIEPVLAGGLGPEYGNELEYLRTLICGSRKKLEDDPAKPGYIPGNTRAIEEMSYL
jgi:hypothetical protein